MSKFNKSKTLPEKIASHKDATLNYEGGLAFRVSPKSELMLRAACSLMGEPKFYQTARDSDADLLAVTRQVLQEDPEFVLKMAAFCRNELHLRSVPIALLVEYANSDHVGIPNSRKYVNSVIQRADDMTELLAYQFTRNELIPRKNTKYPQLIKHALRAAFSKFDEYQLSKYNRDGEVKLKDVVFISHPAPASKEHEAIIGQLVNGTLPPADTWEVALSAIDGRSKKEKWDSIIPRMGYMATLRNLRNMLQVGANMDPVLGRLTDPVQVRKSKQFPFRFFSAYREVEKVQDAVNRADVSRTMGALETALDHSINRIPKLPGVSLIAADTSGSMQSPLSKNSSVQCIDLSLLFTAMSTRFCDQAIPGRFDSTWQVFNFPPNALTFDNMNRMAKGGLGGATYGYLIPKWLLDTNTKVDRMIIFSDFQVYNESRFSVSESFATLVEKYRREINPNVYVYSIHLNGYGTTSTPQDAKNTALIAGWSDRIFDFIHIFESDSATMIKTIEDYGV